VVAGIELTGQGAGVLPSATVDGGGRCITGARGSDVAAGERTALGEEKWRVVSGMGEGRKDTTRLLAIYMRASLPGRVRGACVPGSPPPRHIGRKNQKTVSWLGMGCGLRCFKNVEIVQRNLLTSDVGRSLPPLIRNQRLEVGQLADAHKYRAFISYSRADATWVKLLHTRLEQYVLPDVLRTIKPGLRYDRHPLKPIFRDEDELVPGQDLPARIRGGLKQSEFLIVVCSPAAVASEWVDVEIREFLALGRRDMILAVVIEGMPNAVVHGLAPELECLPASLRLQLAESWTENARDTSGRHSEPLWVDFRNELRRDRIAFLRLVAALLSLSSLDELVQRDRAYRRRKTTLTWTATITAATAVLLLGLVWQLQVRDESIKSSNVLADLARKIAKEGNWELSARYALLGMKRSGSNLISFEPRAAEDALISALISNLRVGVSHDLDLKLDSMTALSQDGALMAVGNKDGIVQLIDTATGKPHGPSFQVGKMDGFALSPDGTLLVSNFEPFRFVHDPTVSELRIWSTTTGGQVFKTLKCESPFEGRVGANMKLSPDNRKLAVASDCGSVTGDLTLFDLASGTSKSFPVGPSATELVTFSGDGRIFAVVGTDGYGQLWRTNPGVAITSRVKVGVESRIDSQSTNTCISLAPNNTTLAVGMSDGSLVLWDMKLRRMIMANHRSGHEVVSITFTSDAAHFGAQFSDGSIRIWEADIYDGEYRELSAKFVPSGQFAFLPDNMHMLTLTSGSLRIWKINAYEKAVELPENGNLWPIHMGLDPDKAGSRDAVFSPDGHALAVWATYRQMVTLDVRTLSPTGPVVTFQGDVGDGIEKARVSFSSDNTLIGYQNSRGTWLVNGSTGEQWRLPDHPRLYGAIAFSPGGRIFATADDIDGSSEIRLWDVRSHTQIGTSLKVQDFITVLSFSPDGQHLFLGSNDTTIMLSDLNRNAKQTLLIQGFGFLAILPDGRRILTTGSSNVKNYDSQLQIWDIATASPVGSVMNLDSGLIHNIKFLGDGTFALVVEESSLELWDLISNVKIGTTMELPIGLIETAGISPDERHLLAVTNWNQVYSWDLGRALRLRGRALEDAVCETLLPGKLSKLSISELTAVPILDPRHDGDACAR
jgi:WD40 repeat protein